MSKLILALVCLMLGILPFSPVPKTQPVSAPPPPRIQVYYIAADEVTWDYAPHGRNLAGLPGSENEGTGGTTKFRKAIYREYTDDSFKTLKPRPPEWEHLGILGPVIRAEVGDLIQVHFKNNTKIFCSMHPHGLLYTKESEGAAYNDSLPGEQKRGVTAPGETYTYTWSVPERAGPGPMDPSSVIWMYHSHFVEPRDMNTGLFGPIIVSKHGTTRPDGTPSDVDREFVVAFAVFDETESWYLEANTFNQRKYSQGLKFTDPAVRMKYLFYSLNGLIDGNLPELTMKKGARVRWYLLSNSNDEDVHTPHWHAQTVLFNGMRTDTVSLAPMAMGVADMIPDAVGTWLFHCHVNEHLEGGMVARFTVTP